MSGRFLVHSIPLWVHIIQPSSHSVLFDLWSTSRVCQLQSDVDEKRRNRIDSSFVIIVNVVVWWRCHRLGLSMMSIHAFDANKRICELHACPEWRFCIKAIYQFNSLQFICKFSFSNILHGWMTGNWSSPLCPYPCWHRIPCQYWLCRATISLEKWRKFHLWLTIYDRRRLLMGIWCAENVSSDREIRIKNA